MVKHYERSLEQARIQAGDDPMAVDTYPWLCVWQGRLLAGSEIDKPTLLADLAQIRAIGHRLCAADRSFWHAMIEADAALVATLYDGTLADHVSSFVDLVLRAGRPAATPRELASVIENLAFVEALWPGDGATREAVGEVLRRLRQARATVAV